MAIFRGALGALAIVGLVGAPPAHADADSFIAALENDPVSHFWGANSALIREGYAICADLAAGDSFQYVTNEVMGNPSATMDSVSARELIIAAEDNLC